VTKDLVEAFAYWSLAGKTDEVARRNIARLKTLMSPADLLRGQQRAKELQKEIEVKIAATKAGK
jgi:hypothetical protein